MTKALLLAILAGQVVGLSDQAPAVPKRTVIVILERSLDNRINKAVAKEPFDLLGATRGIYLESYGAVFTTEVNLIVSPNLSPFKQSFTKAEKERIRARKLAQLGPLKEIMRQMLISSASALELPAPQKVVVGVSLFYFPWEDTAGLPGQIVMKAECRDLLRQSTIATAIHTEEF